MQSKSAIWWVLLGESDGEPWAFGLGWASGSRLTKWGYGTVYVSSIYGKRHSASQAHHKLVGMASPVQPQTDWLLSVWGSKRELVEFSETPQYDVTVLRSCTLLVNAGLVRQAGGWGGGVHHRSPYLVVHVALIFSGRNSKSRSEMRPLESEMAGEIEIISNRQLLESQGAYPHIPFLNSHRKSSKCLHANLVSSDASLPRTQSCSRASKEDTGPLIVIPTASTRLLFKMPHRPCTTLQSAREVWPSRPRIVSVPMWEKFKAALQLALLQVLLSGLNLLNTFRPRLSPCPPIRLALTAIAR